MKTLFTSILLFFAALSMAQINFEQSMSINSTGDTTHASAILDIQSANRGVLIPRMSSAQRNSITSPAAGLLVFDTDANILNYYNGTQWRQDKDESPLNELQNLSFSGSTLSISSGNSVTIPTGKWLDGTSNSIYYNAGNVGIGTAPNSANALDIEKSTTGTGLRLLNNYTGSGTKTGIDINMTNGGSGGKIGIKVTTIGGNASNTYGIQSYAIAGTSGNSHAGDFSVSGSGTALYGIAFDPTGKAAELKGEVDIDGETFLRNSSSSNHVVGIYPASAGSGDSTAIMLAEDNDGSYGMMLNYDGVNNEFTITGKNLGGVTGPHFKMKRDNGDVAIGQEFATGYRLSVDGKIICEEVRVELQGDWPDYVFADEYELRSIEETAEFIEKNKHLPGIPSAAEVAENGITVGDMQKRMMEKIEELTLHMIEMNKENKELKARVAELESK